MYEKITIISLLIVIFTFLCNIKFPSDIKPHTVCYDAQ